MTMLAHTDSPFKPARNPATGRAATGAANARPAMTWRFGLFALKVLIAGGAVAGVIALKAAFYFSRFSY
jgi:hypothetical protein